MNIDNQDYPMKIENFSAKKVVCGYYHSMAINEQGSLYCWGWNDSGQLGF